MSESVRPKLWLPNSLMRTLFAAKCLIGNALTYLRVEVNRWENSVNQFLDLFKVPKPCSVFVGRWVLVVGTTRQSLPYRPVIISRSWKLKLTN